jgi:hypothetical protein
MKICAEEMIFAVADGVKDQTSTHSLFGREGCGSFSFDTPHARFSALRRHGK